MEMEEEGEKLILPFKVVRGSGGRYCAVSFTAGFQCGEISSLLAPRTILATTKLIYRDLIEQCDLIAMQHGYSSEVLQQDSDWAQIGFTRNDNNISLSAL